MKNIYEILKSYGIEIPEDKKEAFDKEVLENYKTVKEVDTLRNKLETVEGDKKAIEAKYNTDIAQRDTDLATLQEKLKNAGADANKLSNLQTDFDTLQQTYNTAKADYEKQLAEQAYDFAIKENSAKLKFSSNSAKKAFMSDLKAKNLSMENGKILGFDDFVNAYKEQDAGAFITDNPSPKNDEPKPSFSTKTNPGDKTDPQPEPTQKERPIIW
nr:MAG TPA: minor structural protein [Caudoviricetes sp.]